MLKTAFLWCTGGNFTYNQAAPLAVYPKKSRMSAKKWEIPKGPHLIRIFVLRVSYPALDAA
jgi:hypothetical protein